VIRYKNKKAGVFFGRGAELRKQQYVNYVENI
jgi:hypothetical protein